MNARQRIVLERRQYNKWVADQTLEDYALRFTASRARRTTFLIGNTALGAISFLACEAIGGTVTLTFGYSNAVAAIVAVGALMFLIGLPISYYAAKFGVDIDLLTRGAGFGYLGSTVTSLIYASFTFLLFAIEASIMSIALQMCLGIPLAIAHLITALIVIPIAAYGIRIISKLQLATQPIWLVLQFAPLIYLAFRGRDEVIEWTHYAGARGPVDGSIDIVLFGMAASMLLSLLPQIGEQVDYLRFLPPRQSSNKLGWWTALIATGPGWVVIGGIKLLAGSFLAFLALKYGLSADRAVQPAELYRIAFSALFHSPSLGLVLTGLFIVTCQIKINVTNAYAGSIAWSNFFSRLTHSHPGRVVWLVFNVLVALLLMEIGVFRVIQDILGLYANFAVGWIGALTADLVVNKPLGFSPNFIEFKRAHLYDINPVGIGAMLISMVVSTGLFFGVAGSVAQAMSPFVGLLIAFAAAPLIAWWTRGRYYIARPATGLPEGGSLVRCVICENEFERADVAFCLAYSAPICSLCCTLEARCHDMCKEDSRAGDQLRHLAERLLPTSMAAFSRTRLGRFLGVEALLAAAIAVLLTFIGFEYAAIGGADVPVVRTTLWIVFFSLLIVSGVVAWLLVLAQESRRAAEAESERQTVILMNEIEAHERTDAALQKAKDVAEAANIAKSRYIVGLSHEIRTPLNSIFGYAQLMERDPTLPTGDAVRVIRRSAAHLSNLVDGLLDISRIESGTLRLQRDKVRPTEFLDQIVDMFRLQASAKGIGFFYEKPNPLPGLVRTDEKRLRQILINLLSNAIKYTTSGSATLRVRYRHQIAEFEITDTGIGIELADLQKIFEPFERGQSPQARAQPGTGLGLTITKLLTEIMGGEISVESQPGAGSTFRVRLMLSEVTPTADDVVQRRTIGGYAGPRIKVLIADDDADHVDFVSRILKPLGFVLFNANNGAGAIELARAVQPDLALLDISMPGANGWEVAAALRTLNLPKLKIVMVSANVHDSQAPAGDVVVNDGYLAKPLDVQLLLERIETLLGLRWIGDVAKSATAPVERQPPVDYPATLVAHLAELQQLGRIGHVRGIERKLGEMEAEDRVYAALVAELRDLVRAFELKRFLEIVAITDPAKESVDE
ncbi:MAG TPA: ATP-binding protein [Stellaceae bacterium]|jgi:signal transduction histidine kinase/DNA-binding NarL/FixJ family response regulator|nr:ATP-binding protein [Stellaceae bacterium]